MVGAPHSPFLPSFPFSYPSLTYPLFPFLPPEAGFWGITLGKFLKFYIAVGEF